jgi:hypothetical protein
MRRTDVLRRRLLPWLGVALLASACALRVTPVPIEPHLPPDTSLAPAERPILAVGHFRDVRGPQDRVALRPPLSLSAFELRRRGQNRTGDEAFSDDVAAGLRRDAAATLERAAIFRNVLLVDVEAEDARAWARQHADHIVLTAAIEAFAGFQHQDSVLSLARVGWLRNRYARPEGHVSVRYRLWDGTGLRLETWIETRHPSPQRSIAAAALDAMAVANERLATRLFRHLVPEAERYRRSLRVTLLDACGIGEEQSRWKIREASLILEREAALRLQAHRRVWTAPADPRDDAVLAAVRALHPSPDGAVLALVPPAPADGFDPAAPAVGRAVPLGAHALVRCTADGRLRTVSIAHEVAHLFGAVHVRDRTSVMHPVAEFEASFFDPLNRRILRTARDRPFDAPLPPDLVRHLEAIYRVAARAGTGADPAGLEAARAALADVPPASAN